MVRAILHGCNGAMGQVISQLAAEDPELEIVAGVDLNTDAKNGYPVFASLEACSVEADVLIDFSTAKAMDSLLEALAAKKLPAVICTTGLTPPKKGEISPTVSNSRARERTIITSEPSSRISASQVAAEAGTRCWRVTTGTAMSAQAKWSRSTIYISRARRILRAMRREKRFGN